MLASCMSISAQDCLDNNIRHIIVIHNVIDCICINSNIIYNRINTNARRRCSRRSSGRLGIHYSGVQWEGGVVDGGSII